MNASNLSNDHPSAHDIPVRRFEYRQISSPEQQNNVIAHFLPAFMQTQLESNWCWAAVAVSVGLFFQTGQWTQCATANYYLNLSNCCNTPCPSNCNVYGNLEKCLAYTQSLNKYILGTQSKDELYTQLNYSRPVGTRVVWNSQGAHFNMISGYSYPEEYQGKKNTDKADFDIEIQDPLYGNTFMKYSDYPDHYHDGGKWATSYLTQPAS